MDHVEFFQLRNSKILGTYIILYPIGNGGKGIKVIRILNLQIHKPTL